MHGRSRHRILHFTFDDGPRIETTPTLLDHLDEAGVRATFFLVGRQLDGDRGRRAQQVSLAREMVRRGHTIGWHGFDHRPLTEMTEDEIEDQIARSEEVFERTFGARPWLFRPPYGRHNEKTDGVLSEHGYTQVLWALNAEGRHIESAEGVRDAFISSLKRREESRRPGGIVILHDTHAWVVDAFPLIHRAIEERNCALLARGEELWEVVDDLRLFHIPRAEGDPSAPSGVHSLPEEVLETRQARLRARARLRCGT
jgi:peptidoglycan/xylan/chitin deacetylase (PgdA/CDA1 family)